MADIKIQRSRSVGDPPGSGLYSTKLNMTTPTTIQDRRAAMAISSSADTFSFARSPWPADLTELCCCAGGRKGGERATTF